MSESIENATRNKKHYCSFEGCNKKFSRPSRLQTHLLSHTGERPFKCDRCDKSFTRNAHLKRHIDVNHEGLHINEEVNCPDCGVPFANKYSLKKHAIKEHTAKKLNKCEECNVSFVKNHMLKRHMIEFHRDSYSGIIYDCDQCGKELPNLWHLDRHRRKHKYHFCDKCGVDFEKWSDLIQHKEVVHSQDSEKPSLMCTLCSKEFRNKANVEKHSIVHSEDRVVFQCPEKYCPRYFYFKRNLNAHLQSVHLGVNFSCSQSGCEQQFSTKQKLLFHLETVHRNVEDSNLVGIKRKQKPPSFPRNVRKDKGDFKKPMLAILTGIEVNNSNAKQFLQGEVRNLDKMEEIKDEVSQFLANTSEATSDSEVDVGCKRKGAEPVEAGCDILGTLKRLEPHKHFQRFRVDSTDSESDFEKAEPRKKSKDAPSLPPKTYDFSKFLHT